MIEPANFVTKYRLYEEAIKILRHVYGSPHWDADPKTRTAIDHKVEELQHEQDALVKTFCKERKSL